MNDNKTSTETGNLAKAGSSKESKNPYSLYSNMPGYLVAEAEIASGIAVAVTLGDPKKAYEFIKPILHKHSNFGATDTAVREVVLWHIEKYFNTDVVKVANVVTPSPDAVQTTLGLLQNAVRAKVQCWIAITALEDRLHENQGEPLSDYLKEKLHYAVECLAQEFDEETLGQDDLKQVLGKLRLNMPTERHT